MTIYTCHICITNIPSSTTLPQISTPVFWPEKMGKSSIKNEDLHTLDLTSQQHCVIARPGEIKTTMCFEELRAVANSEPSIGDAYGL